MQGRKNCGRQFDWSGGLIVSNGEGSFSALNSLKFDLETEEYEMDGQMVDCEGIKE